MPMSHVLSEKTRRLPGEAGVWIFVGADMLMFGLFFTSFVIERSKNVELYNLSQQALNFNYGGINTLILLTSSWFVVLAVHAAKMDKVRHVAYLLAAGALCGLAFCVLKVVEYTEKISHGISMLTNDFFMYYFILTGIHFFHVIVGTVMLFILCRKALAGTYHSRNVLWLESGATYWHMVDLLWIILFPLLYLMR
ncbi:MAG: cytochrome c oxidase subunit 3 family protein [Rhodocyclaceae bacterium]|nr:cytochrome c oxidase subunit 3 family protein [Rhodocyclaceae bacterium]